MWIKGEDGRERDCCEACRQEFDCWAFRVSCGWGHMWVCIGCRG